MEIRVIHERDAEAFLSLRKQVVGETLFMLREPDEITMTAEQQQKQIRQMFSQGSHLLLVVEHDEQLVGFLIGTRGELKRNRHSLSLVVGILQAFTGRGIGTQLFMAMEQWASLRAITRLELTVMTHNQAGVALYKKQGFEIEGRKRHSLLVGGHYVDEYLMAKLLI
jgi:RimJ/RimL family protein N-acetyltransferase